MNHHLATLTCICLGFAVQAQNNTEGVSISNVTAPPSKNAMLDIQSSSKGLLVPRVLKSDIEGTGILNKNNIITNEDGLMVFVTSPASDYGYWYFDRSTTPGEWKKLVTSDLGGLWKKSTVNPDNINYLGGNVSINGNPNPAATPASEALKRTNLDTYPLQVFTLSNPNVSLKFGGEVTTKTFNGTPATTGHMNEINCDEGSLDLQFWNGQPVHMGSSLAPIDVEIYGQLYVHGTIYPSDSTLKTNISPLINSISLNDMRSKFKAIKTHSFYYKSDLSKKVYGLIAQEVQPLFPEIVKPHKLTYGKSADGKNLTKDILTVDYSALSIISFEMVKNLIIENDLQKSLIDAQKAEIDALKNQMQTVLNRLNLLEGR